MQPFDAWRIHRHSWWVNHLDKEQCIIPWFSALYSSHLGFTSDSLQTKKTFYPWTSLIFALNNRCAISDLLLCVSTLCHCSSQESAKAKTQKEVIKTLKELKLHLPPEKRHNNKSTTVNTLKYALRCVKQVEGKLVHFFFSLCLVSFLVVSLLLYLAANEEYYQLLMINDSQPSGLDVSSYTIEEIDSITSEYTLKNNVRL